MKDAPILFSGPMVRALLAGTKTQTRRLAKWKSQEPGLDLSFSGLSVSCVDKAGNWSLDSRGRGAQWESRATLKAFAPGMRLWVKETWTATGDGIWSINDARMRISPNMKIRYRADEGELQRVDGGWWPSLFMPREFSRLTLTVVAVEVERLHDITDKEAEAEGVEFNQDGYLRVIGWRNYLSAESVFTKPRESYASLWDHINGDKPGCKWVDNPWIVATSFKVEHRNIDVKNMLADVRANVANLPAKNEA